MYKNFKITLNIILCFYAPPHRLPPDWSLRLESLDPPLNGTYSSPLYACTPNSSSCLNVLARPAGAGSLAAHGAVGPGATTLSSNGECPCLPVLLFAATAPASPAALPVNPSFAEGPFHHDIKPFHARPSATQTAFTMSLRSSASRTARQIPRRGASAASRYLSPRPRNSAALYDHWKIRLKSTVSRQVSSAGIP